MNCFVTKFKDKVPNDATHNPFLHKVNEVVIDTSSNASGSSTRCFLIRGDKKGDVYMDVVGNGTIAGETHHEHDANFDKGIPLNVINAPVYVKVGDIDKVTYVSLDYTATLFKNFNFEFIAESFPNLKTIAYHDAKRQLINNISSLSNLVNLTSLSVAGKNVIGNISSLSNLINLTSVDVAGSNVMGEIKDLLDALAKAKKAHTLTIYSSLNQLTYNGVEFQKKVVTFKDDGTYAVADS